MKDDDKYDISCVINSLGKILSFEGLNEEAKDRLERNIVVLEKILEKQ